MRKEFRVLIIILLLGLGSTQAQWLEQDQFLSINELFDIRMLNATDGIAVGKGNLLLCTVSGGLLWDGGGSLAPDLRAASIVGSRVWFCNNAGAIYSEANPSSCSGELEAVANPSLNDMTDFQMLDNVTGFAISNEALWFSNNGWFSSSNVDASKPLNTLWFNLDLNGFTGANNGQIIKYFNTSGTWLSSVVVNIGEPVRDIHFFDLNNGYACGDNGAVFRTVDGGENWENVCVPTSNNLMGIIATSSLTAHTVGQEIYRTQDGGLSWYQMSSPDLMPTLNSIWFNDEDNGWVVGKNGFIGATQNAGGSGTLLVKTGIQEIALKFSVYPNPANYFIYLEGETHGTTWSLFDLTGNFIASDKLTDNKISTFDVKSGMYLLELNKAGIKGVNKIFILK